MHDAEEKDDCRDLVSPETSLGKKSGSEEGKAKNRAKRLRKRKDSGIDGDDCQQIESKRSGIEKSGWERERETIKQ